MGKIYIEEQEITIKEKKETDNGEHIIEKNYYINRSIIKTEFKSSIFSYSDNEKILISKTRKFNEDYFKIVLFNDKAAKAWNIIELSADLNIEVKRLNEAMFFVTGCNIKSNISSQVSFCKLKPSTRVEEKTINFAKLINLHYLGDSHIVVDYEDFDAASNKTYNTLAMYSYEGRLEHTFYEYCKNEGIEYSYTLENNELKVFKKTT